MVDLTPSHLSQKCLPGRFWHQSWELPKFNASDAYTVKLGNKERFDKEQIGIKEQFKGDQKVPY